MINLGFVILNYNGDQITINCVDSLLKYYPKSLICIVDNHSERKPIERIIEKYQNIENVKILKSDKNYGYAVGNNIGINYLRENGVDYIAVVNNDTVFPNGDLIEQIKSSPENAGVISLELDNTDGTKQSPYGLVKGPIKTYLKIGIRHFLIIIGVYKLIRWIKRKFIKSKEQLNIIEYDKLDYVISGAAFILTPAFFEKYNQLFNKTFLYCEEHILAMYLKKAKLKTYMLFDTKIVHLESQTATFSSYKKLWRAHISWWKGLPVVFKSSKGIKKSFSKRNYQYKMIKK